MAYGKYDFDTELDGFGDTFEMEWGSRLGVFHCGGCHLVAWIPPEDSQDAPLSDTENAFRA